MKEQNIKAKKVTEEKKSGDAKPQEKIEWETPKLEDVSEQVMAQPYIRFT